MSGPGASVLLPVRDGPFLAEALASLRTQTCEDFEVCLQLDGAAEDVRAVAREASRLDHRVHVASGPPRGIVAALQAAAARARGALFVRLDADDVCTPDRIERLVDLATRRPDVGFVASLVTYVSATPLSEGLVRYEAWINGLVRHDEIVRARFVECPMPHPAWAVRRRVFETLGGYRDGAFPEDYDFFLRAVESGTRFEKVDRTLLYWRDRPERLSRSDPRYALGAFFDLKLRFLLPLLERDGRDIVIAGTGKAARRWCRRLREAGCRVVAFLESPFRAERLVQGLPVVPLDRLPEAGAALVLIAVGGDDREGIARALEGTGRVEGADVYGVQ